MSSKEGVFVIVLENMVEINSESQISADVLSLYWECITGSCYKKLSKEMSCIKSSGKNIVENIKTSFMGRPSESSLCNCFTKSCCKLLEQSFIFANYVI